MKHILNNLSEEEKNSIREQHNGRYVSFKLTNNISSAHHRTPGGMNVVTENFNRLLCSKLGDVKPLIIEQSSGGDVSCTEEYNGTSWSAGGALSTARQRLAGAGTQNAALAFGGLSGGALSCTEEYNGTSWSSGGSLITARTFLAGAGTQNAGIAFGGQPGASCTEEYNGTSWTAGSGLITARQSLAGAGLQNAGLAFGGLSPTTVACTEEYNTCILTKTI